MGIRRDIKFFLTIILSLSLAFASGCATETGRSTMGGLVYGSMVGTTIVPGIGSAIGAGVGMLAGAFEGSQREREKKIQDEAYRQKFYRLRNQSDEHASSAEGVYPPTSSSSPADRFGNLVALQERQPIENLLEQGIQPSVTPSQTHEKGAKLNPSAAASESEGASPRIGKLYKELARLRRERRELEGRVYRLSALLVEYDRSSRKSPTLLKQMEETLELSAQEVPVVKPTQDNEELYYLQREYDLARRQNNVPLAESIARRYEILSGRKLGQGPVSSFSSGF